MSERDETLFAEIHAHHLGIVWKTVHAFTLSKDDQEDLYQEILIALWEAVPNFEARAKLSTYVYRVAYRRALNWKRSQRRYENKLTRYENELPATQAASANPENDARLEWLYRAIHSLKPLDRTLCLLYLDGISYREMSEILGLSEDNVGIRVYRCKQQLTQLLRQNHE